MKCGNCNKRSAQTLYCFQCCSFWCEEFILGHNIIRTNKEHRTLALKDFQDQDIEAVLKRPAFCQKKGHEKEELKFFCKDCKVAICNTCVVAGLPRAKRARDRAPYSWNMVNLFSFGCHVIDRAYVRTRLQIVRVG